MRGVVDEADVVSGKVMLIGARGFHGAGDRRERVRRQRLCRGAVQVAVGRRCCSAYPFGHVDQSIGKNVARGTVGLIAPNRLISKDFEEITLDGVKMVFQNAPDTEAPVEMNTYFPQFNAFWAAESMTGTIHNIYTLRGAAVRNALQLVETHQHGVVEVGQDAEVMFASHSWPRWGNAHNQEVLRTQRDAYANLNNQALHYASQGMTIDEIQNVYRVPKSLQRQLGCAQLPGG